MSVTEFEEGTDVLAESKTLLWFTASWCGPCKQLKPILEKLADDKELNVIRVDIDTFPALAGEYEVQSVPTLKWLVDGEVENTIVGVKNRTFLIEELKL